MRKPSTIAALLYSGIAFVVCLLSYETVHFWASNGFVWMDEQYSTQWYSHPGCKEHPDEPADFTCPIRAYNWVEVECWTASCTYRDPNAPAVTAQRQQQREHNLQQDLNGSLDTVPLVSREQAQKALHAFEVRQSEAEVGDLDHIEDLSPRDLKRFRSIAEMGHP